MAAIICAPSPTSLCEVGDASPPAGEGLIQLNVRCNHQAPPLCGARWPPSLGGGIMGIIVRSRFLYGRCFLSCRQVLGRCDPREDSVGHEERYTLTVDLVIRGHLRHEAGGQRQASSGTYRYITLTVATSDSGAMSDSAQSEAVRCGAWPIVCDRCTA